MTLIIDFENKIIKGIHRAKDFKNHQVKRDIIELINKHEEEKEDDKKWMNT